MLKVMIVDDDVPMVDYLKQLIPWHEHGLKVTATAYSSEVALEVFDQAQPALVITDIGMPGMNGVELARIFKKKNSSVRIIFLTCHEDFDYLKEAMSIDADDYILKDELNVELLTQSIAKSMERAIANQKVLESEFIRNDMERNKLLLMQSFFEELMRSPGDEKVMSYGRHLGVKWTGRTFSAAVCHLNVCDLLTHYGNRDTPLIMYAAYNIACELASSYPSITPILYDAKLWIIANHDDKATGDRNSEFLEYLHALKHNIQKFLKVSSYITIYGTTFEREHFKGLQAKMRNVELAGFYSSDELRMAASPLDDWPDLGSDLLDEGVDRLLAFCHQRHMNLFSIQLNYMEQLIFKAKPHPEEVRELLVQIAQKMSIQAGHACSSEVYQYLPRTVRNTEAFKLMKWFGDGLILAQKEEENRAVDSPDIRKINEFINNNIYRNITSLDMARHLHMNPSYFSRYFKKTTGINFTDHMHLLKIEEAKRLLIDHNETVETVAYMLGYSDRAYFSRVFKRYAGQSPSEFKREHSDQEEKNGVT